MFGGDAAAVGGFGGGVAEGSVEVGGFDADVAVGGGDAEGVARQLGSVDLVGADAEGGGLGQD